MQIPPSGAAYGRRVIFGRYVGRRLRAAQLNDLAESVKAATTRVKEAGRAWEDAAEPVQDALADRDAADEDLDAIAQELRLALASRSVQAMREHPYTSIFPQGLDYYIVAPVDQEVARYEELISRLAEKLPEEDPVRRDGISRLQTALNDYKEAASTLSSVRSSEAIARTTLETAQDDWAKLQDKVYGAVVDRFGRKKAERFFPRRRSGDEEEKEDGKA